MSDYRPRFRELIRLQERSRRKKQEADDADRAHREYEIELWNDLAENEGVKTMTLDLGPPFGEVQFQRRQTVTSRIYDIDAAAKALEEMGLADEILTHGVRKKPLNQYVRDWEKSGQPFPEGVDLGVRRYFTISRKQS